MTAGRGLALAALIVVATAITLPYMLDAAVGETRHQDSVTNETFTPQAGSITVLEQSKIPDANYDPTVNVYDENETLLEASGNYTWYESNGTIKTLSGGDLDGDSIAYISYSWTGQTKRQHAAETVLVDIAPVAELMAVGTGLLLMVVGLIFLRGAA